MSEVNKRIQEALKTIAQEEDVRILYACESGSRAWEFASQNSDYDVRFLYVRPRNAYLRLDPPRDVIERPIVDELDINGWDIFKALRLLRNSNPPLLEWLFSPIIYLENSASIASIRDIARRFYAPASVFYHYTRMASGNYQQYIAQKTVVSLKKYLYVLRPIVALLFLEQQHTLPSTSFSQTLASIAIPQDVRERIHQLVQLKRTGEEIGLGTADPVLNAFIDEQLARWSTQGAPDREHEKSTFQELNTLLLHILAEEELAAALQA